MAASILLLVAAPIAAPPQADGVDALRLGEWHMLGPLPKSSVTGLKSPSVLAGKMQAGVPYTNLAETHEGPENMRLPWTQPDVAAFLTKQDADAINPRSRLGLDTGKIEIAKLLPLVQAAPEYSKNATAYLYVPVYANAMSTTPVQCGAEGKVSLWWNGKPLISQKRTSQFSASSFPLKLDVVPGLNHLLVEVQSNTVGWSFEMQSLRRIDNPRIHRAIDLGVQYLLDRQAIDGSWPTFQGYPNGVSALAIYTLVKSGVSPRHESVLKGLEHLRQKRGAHTYVVALELMAYHAGADPQDRELIEELAEDLVDWQMPNGLWAYGQGSGGWSGDLSNAQYAALGLRAAAASGAKGSHPMGSKPQVK
ncbi:MAG: hypothetical protein O3A95_03460 [Planctomycetota bacterium]|nr:hypothetical protein [Planctomycetota bacterium]